MESTWLLFFSVNVRLSPTDFLRGMMKFSFLYFRMFEMEMRFI